MAGGDIEIDGQKLTDFDLQLILEVVVSNAQRPDALDDETGSEVVVVGSALGGRVGVPKGSCVGVAGGAGGAGGDGGAGCKASSGYVSYTPSPVASPAVSPLKQMTVMIPSMSIGYNAITEKGASLLARSISSGRVCIQRLNLRGNKIGRDGAVALLEGLMVAHSPTSLLDLSDNQICGLTAEGDVQVLDGCCGGRVQVAYDRRQPTALPQARPKPTMRRELEGVG